MCVDNTKGNCKKQMTQPLQDEAVLLAYIFTAKLLFM